MHRSQSTETRGSKGMRPLNRRFAPPIRGWRPSERIRISNLCPLLFLDSELLGQAPDTGGVDATSRRSREASFNGADGVVENGTSSKERIPKQFGNPDHPVCAAAVASHLFVDGAAIPPVSGGESPASHSSDRAYGQEITWS